MLKVLAIGLGTYVTAYYLESRRLEQKRLKNRLEIVHTTNEILYDELDVLHAQVVYLRDLVVDNDIPTDEAELRRVKLKLK